MTVPPLREALEYVLEPNPDLSTRRVQHHELLRQVTVPQPPKKVVQALPFSRDIVQQGRVETHVEGDLMADDGGIQDRGCERQRLVSKKSRETMNNVPWHSLPRYFA